MSATPRDELERQLAAHRAAVARLEERLGAAAAPAAAAPVVTPRIAEAPAPAEAYTQRDAPPWLLVPGPKTLPALAEPRGRPPAQRLTVHPAGEPAGRPRARGKPSIADASRPSPARACEYD